MLKLHLSRIYLLQFTPNINLTLLINNKWSVNRNCTLKWKIKPNYNQHENITLHLHISTFRTIETIFTTSNHTTNLIFHYLYQKSIKNIKKSYFRSLQSKINRLRINIKFRSIENEKLRVSDDLDGDLNRAGEFTGV